MVLGDSRPHTRRNRESTPVCMNNYNLSSSRESPPACTNNYNLSSSRENTPVCTNKCNLSSTVLFFYICLSYINHIVSYLLLHFNLSLPYPLPNSEHLQLLRYTKMSSMFLQRLMLSDESIPVSSAGYNYVLSSRQQKHEACSLLDLETGILIKMFKMAGFWW